MAEKRSYHRGAEKRHSGVYNDAPYVSDEGNHNEAHLMPACLPFAISETMSKAFTQSPGTGVTVTKAHTSFVPGAPLQQGQRKLQINAQPLRGTGYRPTEPVCFQQKRSAFEFVQQA